MKQKFIEWFTKGNNGVPPAVNAAGEFEYEKTQHMWEAYQGGIAEQAEQVRLLTEQRDAVVVESERIKRIPETNSVAMLLALDSLRSESLPDVGLQKAFESLMYHRETPATDAAIAALRVEGVLEFAAEMAAQHEKLQSGGFFDRQVDIYARVSEMAKSFARQLRESKGAQS